MAREELAQATNYWKHWVIYSSVTFLSIFVFAEFAISVSFLSILSPSTFMYYLTPAGFFLGEALVSFFASVLLFLGLFNVLRRKVYVKKDNSLEFDQSKSYLMLPFYLVSLSSLGIYISLTPLDLSNILTYAVFLILFESFIEHFQVTDYGLKVEIRSRLPESLQNLLPSRSEKKVESEKSRKLKEVAEMIEKHEKVTQNQSIPEELSIEDPEVKEIIQDLMGLMEDEEDIKEEIEEEIKEEIEGEQEKEVEERKEKAITDLTEIEGVGKTRAERLYENGLYTVEDIVEGGEAGLLEVSQIGRQTAKKILMAAKEEMMEKKEEISDELTEELEDLEKELLENGD